MNDGLKAFGVCLYLTLLEAYGKQGIRSIEEVTGASNGYWENIYGWIHCKAKFGGPRWTTVEACMMIPMENKLEYANVCVWQYSPIGSGTR
jgi:hypothetical protein